MSRMMARANQFMAQIHVLVSVSSRGQKGKEGRDVPTITSGLMSTHGDISACNLSKSTFAPA